MAPVPSYWYVETDPPGLLPQEIPYGGMLGPEPSGMPAHLIDGATGEIYGEAILMSTLPFPRFRGFFDGKQVILPHGTAEALERFENVTRSLVFKAPCPTCLRKLTDWTTHIRVDVSGGVVKAHYAHNCGSFLDGFHAVNTRQSGRLAGEQAARETLPSAYRTVKGRSS